MSEHNAVQCGFCSPAFLLVMGEVDPTAPRVGLSEVTCRCTGYTGLAAAATAGPSTPGRLCRAEDARLLGGRGDFVADRRLPGQLWARFVRSTHGHAGITVDTSIAAAHPRVVAVLTAADLPEDAAYLPEVLGIAEPTLARTEVRYVGQPIALVLAETPGTAEDAAELVLVDYTPRPVWTEARTEGAPHVVAARTQGDPVTAVFDGADVVLDERFTVPRQTGLPMEPRRLLAGWSGGRLTVWGSTKHPLANRAATAKALGLGENKVRMAPSDVGGAFGVKGELYPEDVLVPLAATLLGRPVKWVEDRDEHLVAINHSREQVWHVRLAAAVDGRLLGAEVDLVSDAGAYVRPLTTLVADEASATFPGPYRFGAYHATANCVLTNKTPSGTVRAPGRFEANFVRERALDLLAERVGLDPAELRRRNLLGPEDLPYDAGTFGEGPVRYPAGDFRGAFARVLALPAPAAVEDGLRRGRAVVPFVELSSLGGTERVRLSALPGGRYRLETASAPSGQGHQTAWARVAADVLDVDPALVDVCCGDTDDGGDGLGTFASRSAVMVGNAVAAAAGRLVAEGGTVVEGTFTNDDHTCPYGALACTVAVDPELLTVRVEELTILCDAGNLIEERLVVGQLTGGVVQGVGGALLEEIAYDAQARPLAAGLDGYLLPLAADVPDVRVLLTNDHPAEENPLGVKGIGEAGIAAAGAAVASAVASAMPELNRHLTGLPLSPSRLLGALRAKELEEGIDA
ncbi:hypothetical protein BU204_05755 [Actinophytocola xanthii]|uniref:Aldehyde oxidase/xanthine dehydrogenase a/b hammerhead domain-containing protein n=2 Tax=Actinophytocola xanthii TaxID=1912961 RepID=A0A1Q8CW70_9PSEU|nr:hypothetical protein BU204_05755 [Actinophytocola xanthii]